MVKSKSNMSGVCSSKGKPARGSMILIQSPIRSDWIKEALESLCKWGLAQKKNQGEYEIFLQKPNQKDLQEYFCKKVCGAETITTVSVTLSDLDKEQKILAEFDTLKKSPEPS